LKWPTVSVVIPVWSDNRLAKCLTALQHQTYEGEIEIIVVDNATPPNSLPLQATFPGVVFLHEPAAGSYNARNTGVHHSRGEIVAFTDADCIPAAGWLKAAATALLADHKADAVGGTINLFMPDPAGPHEAAELYNYLTAFRQGHLVHWRHYTPTANLVTWRRVFDEVGAFNGALMAGGDFEWCRRARRLGKKLVFCKSAVVRHPARTTGKDVLIMMRRGIAGARDRQPGLGGCAVTVTKHCIGPFLDIAMIFMPHDRPLTFRQKLAATMFAFKFRGVAVAERLALQVTHGASPRS
jgi:GT2 family glycosyltransferase